MNSPKTKSLPHDSSINYMITGGAGFVGISLTHGILQTQPNANVVILDNFSVGSRKRTDQLNKLYKSRLTILEGDIRDPKDVHQALKDTNIVFHLAAQPQVDLSIKDPALTIDVNVIGTQVLLDQVLTARENGRIKRLERLHYVSTDEVYGAYDGTPFSETTNFDPSNPYSASKASAEMLWKAYARTYDLPISITSHGNMYGPDLQRRIIPVVIKKLLLNRELLEKGKKIEHYIPLYSNCQNSLREFLHIDDAIHALLLITSEKSTIGEKYNLGTGISTDIKSLVSEIVKRMGFDFNDVVELVDPRPGNDPAYCIDWSKIKKELGWEPQIPLIGDGITDGLALTIRWYEENRDIWQ